MSRFLSLTVLLSSTVLFAQPPPVKIVSDPEGDFVHTPESTMAELGMLRSDEILRLQMDLFGNGKETIFLTYRAGGSKFGPAWTAYVPANEHGYYRIDSIQFRTDFYHAGAVPGIAGPGTLLALHPGKGGGDLIRYDFRDGAAYYSIARTLDFTNPDDRKLFAAIFNREVDQAPPVVESSKPPYEVLSAPSILDKRSSMQDVRDAPTPYAVVSNAAPTATAREGPPAVVKRVGLVWPTVVGIALLVSFVLIFRSRR
jgi:hypothetical protein